MDLMSNKHKKPSLDPGLLFKVYWDICCCLEFVLQNPMQTIITCTNRYFVCTSYLCCVKTK